MVKITLITNNPKEVDIVPETMTVREFLEKHNVNYGLASASIDGVPLQAGGMDMSFVEHQITDRAIVTCLPNKDNGAQAIVVGSSCVIKSTLTPAEIKRIKKFHPEALVMDDEDGEPVFAIDIDEDAPGSINDNGACFGNATSNDGKATITVVLDPTVESTEDLVYDQLGRALMYLKEMEQHLAEVLPELDTEEREIRSMISRL